MPAKTPEQRIAESKAILWGVLAWWLIVVFVLSIVPLIAISRWLVVQWWG